MPELREAEVAEIAARAKAAIRARMASLRAATPAPARAERDARLLARLLELPEYQAARALALFRPIASKQEIDSTSLDAAARAAGKALYYPFMDPSPSGGYRTGFRRVDDPGRFEARGRGFPEPPPDAPEARRGEIDLVVVPALAVSPRGERIGYGAGFYDATLPDVCPPAVALVVAYDFQLLGELPTGRGDFACHGVVTDRRVLRV